MSRYLDTVFSPGLYLGRDERAIMFIEDRLLHQETCAASCMYGNGKDYLFTNVVKRMEARKLSHKLKVLNTISSDELKDFVAALERDSQPTMCLVNLRLHEDVSWFIKSIEQLRVRRGYAFVSFVSAYMGDIYQALLDMERPVTHSLVILKRVPYDDALHVISELSERFGFRPNEEQKQDIYRWSYGHVGMLRTLYLLKRQFPGKPFARQMLLREPTVLERLSNVARDIPPPHMDALLKHGLGFAEKTMLEEFGYIDDTGNLFHPLMNPLVLRQHPPRQSAFSPSEHRVLAYLQEHEGQTIPREDIARIVWGEEEWEDKYSDWAIGQLVYRLRQKLAYGASQDVIETRKGQGFEYRKPIAGTSAASVA